MYGNRIKEMSLKTKIEVPIPIIFRGREITDQGLKKL